MGVYKFYLGAHKSGKEEKNPLFNHLLYTISIMTNVQCRILTWSSRRFYLTATRKYRVGQLHRIKSYFPATEAQIFAVREPRGRISWTSNQLWLRYVDDTFTTLHKDEIANISTDISTDKTPTLSLQRRSRIMVRFLFLTAWSAVTTTDYRRRFKGNPPTLRNLRSYDGNSNENPNPNPNPNPQVSYSCNSHGKSIALPFFLLPAVFQL